MGIISCPFCKRSIPDTRTACPYCRQSLAAASSALPVAASPALPAAEPQPGPTDFLESIAAPSSEVKRTKSRGRQPANKYLPIIALIGALLGGIVAVVIVIGMSGSPEQAQPTAAPHIEASIRPAQRADAKPVASLWQQKEKPKPMSGEGTPPGRQSPLDVPPTDEKLQAMATNAPSERRKLHSPTAFKTAATGPN